MLTSSRLYFQPFNNIDKWPVLKIRISHIKGVRCRRFLLRQIGLEIECRGGAPVNHLYLALKTEDSRDEFYTALLQQKDLHLEEERQEDMTLRWQSRTCSNYDYLLYLNSLADRSFSDLTQYPVMPWVIQDYTSPILDLEKEATFRDLTKPIGALNPERLNRLKECAEYLPEPKYLYGSHYSNPGYILFFLARMAPEYVLCLQNGKFDSPDRMFNSLQDTWQNCLTGSTDFKELIPEFYHGSGDFLVHRGVINFGQRNDGRPVEDVALPPWATDAKDFISKLRSALECDYVSQHLHHWIDLVFGYKQRGEEAVKADNVFHYMTYEGAVDLESIKDPNELKVKETQIMEFGQTPKQLFTTPHPQRKGPTSITPTPLRLSAGNESKVASQGGQEGGDAPCINSEQGENAAEDDSGLNMKNFSHLSTQYEYTLHKNTVSEVHMSADEKSVLSVSQDGLLKMYSLEEQRQLRSVNLSTMALSSCVVLPGNRTIIVGSWDNSVYFYSIEYGRVQDKLPAHDDAVSCMLWYQDCLYTASWDGTVKVSTLSHDYMTTVCG
ncbi:protein FAN-like [Babylonia areolata]|uniref:protein FAN-like n=1 Tax=Babylonia areolata TaxID=304850 RepID=UPI003FD0B6C4